MQNAAHPTFLKTFSFFSLLSRRFEQYPKENETFLLVSFLSQCIALEG